MSDTRRAVLIIGGGPVGALAGLLYAQRGFQVDIFEQRRHPGAHTLSTARAINLSLSPRGISALSAANIDANTLDCIVPMKQRVLHNEDSKTSVIPYGVEGRHNLSIPRERLNSLLLERAASAGARIHLGARCVEIAAQSGRVEVEVEGRRQTREGAMILAADGARSAAREALARDGALTSEVRSAGLGYKEVTLGHVGQWFPFTPEAIHIWPRRGFFMVALPNRDGTLRATLVMPLEGPGPSFARTDPAQIRARFARDFADAAPHAHHIEEEYRCNPTGHISLARASRYAAGRVFLAGDAAHAMAPFLGQGVNVGLEDVAALVQLTAGERDLARVAALYDAARRPEGEAAAALSMLNYEELAQREQGRQAVARKQLRAMGHRLAPQLIDPPLVTMINFLGLSYVEVLRRQQRR